MTTELTSIVAHHLDVLCDQIGARPGGTPANRAAAEYIAAEMRRLGLADSDGLKALYAHGGEFAPTFFDPYQLQDGVYFGISNGAGELVAAGGTHIVDRQEKIAAIGNMYTRADQRGNGYASTIFQAVAATLLADSFADIFLNVDIDNHNAHRIYLRYGFVDYCRYLEGTGVKK